MIDTCLVTTCLDTILPREISRYYTVVDIFPHPYSLTGIFTRMCERNAHKVRRLKAGHRYNTSRLRGGVKKGSDYEPFSF